MADAQLIAQLAPLQLAEPVLEPVVGPGQALPQAPPAPHPFCGPGVSHVPLQSTVPPGQPQFPPEHCFPPVQALLHMPQLLLSVW